MHVNEKGVLENSEAYFHTPSSLAKSLFFYFICAGHFYCDDKYSVKRNNYNSYLLMYIKDGEGQIFFDQKAFQAKANDVVLLNCHEPHAYTTKKWETYWIHFDGNMSKEFFDLLYSRYGVVFPLNGSIIIPKYLKEIIEDYQNSKIPNEALVSCYIQRMLTELLLISSETNAADDLKSNQIQDAINFIRLNYKDKLTINTISQHASMSPFHFSRVFKKETGYSPYEYLTMIRLNKAKTLLKSTKMSIKEIANEVGYNSESNFVTNFKEHNKMTPTEFRKTSF